MTDSYQSQSSPSSSSSLHDDPSRPTECEAHKNSNARRICCRDLKPKDQRTLIDPDLARDCIVGLSDGLTVPFALTAGLSGVGSSRLVVIAGLAELVSGAISMGVGGYLSAQAEMTHYKFTETATRERVSRSCQAELSREVESILGSYGLKGQIVEDLTRELKSVEQQRGRSLPLPVSSSSSSSSTAHDRDDDDERGLTPFILRVGSGLEPISSSRLYISALTIGISYFLGGAIPLLPYVFIPEVGKALTVSVIVTGVILLIFGLVKQRYTGGQVGTKGYIWGAVSTLGVGGLAAGASWGIVRALEGHQ
ncbi:membrane fraction protein [Violaceomyces palustris]|uniref:Membrane fraction protein n=1 Tax=Violaceomyces palustris TaxID=1673888 RepID=A0ACD0NYE9_9BASI|nr:membrane fraction protein [Violaceomyces palustris]